MMGKQAVGYTESGIHRRVQARDTNLGVVSLQKEIKVTRWGLLGKPLCIEKRCQRSLGDEGDPPTKEAEKEQGGKLRPCFPGSHDAWGLISFTMRIDLWVCHMVITGQLWPTVSVEWGG